MRQEVITPSLVKGISNRTNLSLLLLVEEDALHAAMEDPATTEAHRDH